MNTTITAPSSIFALAKAYAANTNSRPALHAVCLNTVTNKAYATNGFALGELDITVTERNEKTPANLYVPLSAIDQARKLHTDKQELVSFTMNDTGEWLIVCRVRKMGIIPVPFTPLTGLTYPPNYDAIMPRDYATVTSGIYIDPHYLKAIAELAIANGTDKLWIACRSDAQHMEASADGIRTITMRMMPSKNDTSGRPTIGTFA